MSDNVRFTWAVGKNIGQVFRGHWKCPTTVQNTLAFIAQQWGRETGRAIHCEQVWFPSSLCPVSLPEGTDERYSEFCPVWDGDVLVACLLKPRE